MVPGAGLNSGLPRIIDTPHAAALEALLLAQPDASLAKHSRRWEAEQGFPASRGPMCRAGTQFQVLRRERPPEGVWTEAGPLRALGQTGDDQLDGVRQELVAGWPVEAVHPHREEERLVDDGDAASSEIAGLIGWKGEPGRTEEGDVVLDRVPGAGAEPDAALLAVLRAPAPRARRPRRGG